MEFIVAGAIAVLPQMDIETTITLNSVIDASV